MHSYNIRDKCHINTNQSSDTFVGMKCDAGDISIHFPLGYHVAGDDKKLRKDIMLLFRVLSSNTDKKDSEVLAEAKAYDYVDFPIRAYIEIISDFYIRGYYKERELHHNISKRGKISWNKTIKKVKPYFQDDQVYYLDFVIKQSKLRENELITLIHEYCVYESFDKVGWLFTLAMPVKPVIKLDKKAFLSIISDKLAHSFNDKNKQLFSNMLAIVKKMGEYDSCKNYLYGTYRFEYIWEKMIDKAFGIYNKTDYFPITTWNVGGQIGENASLKPDSIMLYNGKIYILDAKYYKYGITGKLTDLPESASINKQITYGEYIAEYLPDGKNKQVFNAFLMPFDKASASCFKTEKDFLYIGEAAASWKTGDKKYEKIKGILIDVKHLMSIHARQDKNEIMKLADIIECT